MSSERPALPRLLLPPRMMLPLPLRKPPRFVTYGLECVLQQCVREPLAAGDLDFLSGRRLRIRVMDLGLEWSLTLDGDRLRLLDPGLPADASIGGRTRDLLLLASRHEDPDTLFFQRRLIIEGDTEFGLQVKNLLDSLELDALPPPVRWLLIRAGAAVAQSR